MSVYPTYAACRIFYYVWRPGGAKRGKELKLRQVNAGPKDVRQAVDSLIRLLQDYRQSLEE